MTTCALAVFFGSITLLQKTNIDSNVNQTKESKPGFYEDITSKTHTLLRTHTHT